MRLIDADELKSVLDGFYYPEYGKPNFDFDFINQIIDEQPTVEKETKKRGWKCKPHQKGFLYRLSRQCCYEQQVVNGNAQNGKCGGVMGSDKSFDYLNSYCVSCPYLVLSKYEREKE